MTREDAYKILGLPLNASPTQVRQKYRMLAMKYHPDKNLGNRTASELFVNINQAYRILTGREAPRTAHTEYYASQTEPTYSKNIAQLLTQIIAELESMNLDPETRAKVTELNKLFKSVMRMTRFVSNAYLSVLLGMLFMMVYDLVTGPNAPQLGLGVYPAMMVTVMAAAITHDKAKMRANQAKNLLNDIMQHIR